MKFGAYSNRIYKNKINILELELIQNMLTELNDIKIKIYSDKCKNKIPKLNTTYLKDNFNINTYYANMVVKKVNETIDSNKELQKIYIDDYKLKIDNKLEQIKVNQEKLDYWKDIKNNLISISKNKEYKPYIKPFKFDKENIICFNQTYEFYQFEIMTNKRIKSLRNKLYQLKNKLNRLKQQKLNIENKPYVSCFGTKHLFKLQHTTNVKHDDWYKNWYLKRHNNWVISGSKNHEGGSMCARYENGNLNIMKHTKGTIKPGKVQETQEWISISVEFKYNKDLLLQKIANKETVAYQIKDYGKYFIIIASFDYVPDKKINDYTGEGVNAIDINVDRFAITELDKSGNLIKRKVIYFNLEGKTSNQIDKILDDKINEVLKFCKDNKKPLVREDIKKIKFKDTKNKSINKKLSQFAYDKMITKLDRCFIKNSYAVFKVNPKYTSQMGKIKYMSQKGISIHESASMCIGRRYLFSKYKDGKIIKLYYEDMGNLNRFNIQKITKEFKKIKINDFYKLKKIKLNLNDYKELNKYIKDIQKELENTIK